jgi:hypothetical protein
MKCNSKHDAAQQDLLDLLNTSNQEHDGDGSRSESGDHRSFAALGGERRRCSP